MVKLKKFWQWMGIKGYGCLKCKSLICDKIYKRFNKDKQTKQMLIGYKIECLIEHGSDIEDICQFTESVDILDDYLNEHLEELD